MKLAKTVIDHDVLKKKLGLDKNIDLQITHIDWTNGCQAVIYVTSNKLGNVMDSSSVPTKTIEQLNALGNSLLG